MSNFYIWKIKTPEDETSIAEMLGLPGCTLHEFEYCKACGLLSCGRGYQKGSGINFSEKGNLCQKCVDAYQRSPELVHWIQAFIRQTEWKKDEEEKETRAPEDNRMANAAVAMDVAVEFDDEKDC